MNTDRVAERVFYWLAERLHRMVNRLGRPLPWQEVGIIRVHLCSSVVLNCMDPAKIINRLD